MTVRTLAAVRRRRRLPGLFLVLPGAASLTLRVAGESLVQLQVRPEEGHLSQVHGDACAEYAAAVRRWL